ncbi:YfiR family protein [Methylococcus sp. EFPC2]|uniref:YfiR family protein n=1 Tax=Methylococcus sp. EFPC2 TaxID=2812648 RepID=UPI00196806B4|nr:YfiR family protein [Methylococcus sp. EFPC2]QSA96474.1 YfiR family protein [Methylococcus sp. EFPC2]
MLRWPKEGRRFFSILCKFLVFPVLSLLAPLAFAQFEAVTETELKAAFIYNFAKFAEWPQKPAALNLCVFENDALASTLEKLDGKTLGTQRLQFVMIESSERIGDCHILFLGEAQRENLPRILNSLRTKPTLTVSDAAGFIEKGVMIEMSLNQAHIEFEINAQSASRSGLEISGKLLRLAKRVY